jgi:hypothetical protein
LFFGRIRPAAGPGFPLVSFLPQAKKDTASIPCAGESLRLSPFKNGIHAIFELWVLLRKTQEIVNAGIHAGRLSPKRCLTTPGQTQVQKKNFYAFILSKPPIPVHS